MKYADLKSLLDNMSGSDLNRPVLVTTADGDVFPVYGMDDFEDCGHSHAALVISLQEDDGVHPLYMKGVVMYEGNDEELMNEEF